MRMQAAWALILMIGWVLMGPMEMAAKAAEGHSAELSRSGGSLGHGGIEVGAEPTPPSIKLIAHKDPKAGWNLQVQVDNFRFAPEHASTAHVLGEGHAHLYIDGKKVTRLYGEWYHIPALSPGTHKIMVTLNANSHEDLMVKGKAISNKQEVRVSAK
jgi:hypothetical protein